MSASDDFRDADAMSRRWLLVVASSSRDRRVHVAQVGADHSACGATIAKAVTSADDFECDCRLCSRGLTARVALHTLTDAFGRGWRPNT